MLLFLINFKDERRKSLLSGVIAVHMDNNAVLLVGDTPLSKKLYSDYTLGVRFSWTDKFMAQSIIRLYPNSYRKFKDEIVHYYNSGGLNFVVRPLDVKLLAQKELLVNEDLQITTNTEEWFETIPILTGDDVEPSRRNSSKPVVNR